MKEGEFKGVDVLEYVSHSVSCDTFFFMFPADKGW